MEINLNLLAEASQNFIDPSAWLDENNLILIKVNKIKVILNTYNTELLLLSLLLKYYCNGYRYMTNHF